MTRCGLHGRMFYVQCEGCRLDGIAAASALEVEKWGGKAWWWEVDEMECKHGVEILKKTDCSPCYLAEYRRINGRPDWRVRKTDRHHVTDAAMSFEEIAEELGTSEKAARMAYLSGMAKIRQRPQTIALLRDLLSMKGQRSESRYWQMQTGAGQP